jgi:hypothetical protein
VRRHPLQQGGRSLLRGHVVGDANESRRRGRDHLGVGAGDAVEGHALSDLELRHARPDLRHGAGGLAADGHRQRRRVGIPPLVHLGEVQTDGLDFDHHLSRARFRI